MKAYYFGRGTWATTEHAFSILHFGECASEQAIGPPGPILPQTKLDESQAELRHNDSRRNKAKGRWT
jgi:hypothetical protein